MSKNAARRPPIEQAKLDQNPEGPGSFTVDEVVECEVANGDIVKI